jgi:nucleotide-binding universal stress UspA family protein
MSRIQKILVPIDFSDHSGRALDMAVSLGKELGAKLELLHCYQLTTGTVAPYGVVIPESFDHSAREAAASQLDQWREKAAADGVEVKARLCSTYPSLGIVEAAEELGADLIVMGTRGLSGIKHVLLGSVAERVLRRASCPVVTVKTSDVV